MLLAAIATSIDALAVGITFSILLDTAQVFGAVGLIGITTFVLSAVGVKIGSVFGDKFSSKAQLLGGVILVLIGLKILLEHLGVISF
jgi:putative Mn2+ efflux pump MntP